MRAMCQRTVKEWQEELLAKVLMGTGVMAVVGMVGNAVLV